jgi:hypothetical protein
MRFVATFLLLSGSVFAATAGDPSPDQVEEIIAKFAAKEADFAQARTNYTYRQTARVMTLDDGGNSTGKWEEVTDIVFTGSGQRIEKVAYAPMSSSFSPPPSAGEAEKAGAGQMLFRGRGLGG